MTADAPRAHAWRIAVCDNGCVVVVMANERFLPIAEGHIAADDVELFIAELRQAKAEGDARRRPVA